MTLRFARTCDTEVESAAERIVTTISEQLGLSSTPRHRLGPRHSFSVSDGMFLGRAVLLPRTQMSLFRCNCATGKQGTWRNRR